MITRAALALTLTAALLAGSATFLIATVTESGPTDAARISDVLAGNVPAGTDVTLEDARVVAVTNSSTCTLCATWEKVSTVRLESLSDGARIDAVLKKVGGNLLQYKKQNGVPVVGTVVRFSGTATDASGAWKIDPAKEWVEFDHVGPSVTAADVNAGRVRVGQHVWLEPVTVERVFHSSDGDYHIQVRAPGVPDFTTEITPPHQDELPTPRVGDTLEIYGMVLYDADHDHWEVHPIRCLSRTLCAGGGGGGGGSTVPSAPRELHASPGDGEVRLSWDPPAFAGETPVTSYRVYRATGTDDLALLRATSDLFLIDEDAANGVRYRYAVSAANAAGEGERSAEDAAKPGPNGATEWLFDEFETELDQWTLTAEAGGSAWSLTPERAASGASSATCGDGVEYLPDSRCALASPRLDLSRAETARLVFAHSTEIAGVANPPGVLASRGLPPAGGDAFGHVAVGDAAVVEASADDGQSWSRAFTAPAPAPAGWRGVSLDLAALLGEADARVRFRFTSDAAVEDAGWFVDDVVVEGTRRAPSAPTALTASHPADGVRLSWAEPADAWPGTTYRVYRGASAESLTFYAEAGGRKSFLDASPSADALWYAVTAVDGLEGALSAAVEAPASGGGGGGGSGEELYKVDFESGSAGWTAVRNGPTGTSSWKLVTTQSNSPTHSATCGGGTSYAGGSDCEYVSPTIDVSGAAEPTLRFAHKIGGEASRDYGRVYYTADGGAWTQVGGAYSGVASWADVALSLPAGATSVQVKFRFVSDTNGVQNAAWFVDDVRVTDG